MQINKYKNLGSGWHNESIRHSNAKLTGHAGGLYARQNNISKKGLYANSRQFKINDKISIVCRYGDSRDGFNHFATLYINGVEVEQVKVHYINRTWESYEFQSAMEKLIDKTKALSTSEKEIAKKYIEHPQRTEDDMADLRTVGAIAKMGDIFGNTQKEKNDWKVRMIKAGLGDKGIDMPEDWETLSEDEKERRLNLVTEQLTKKEKKYLYAKGKYVATDGWRGYYQSANAVAGSSDTGTWSDSPCPSGEVTKELQDFRDFLKSKNIKSKIVSGTSSNAFMGKRWVTVPEGDVPKAKKLFAEYIKTKRTSYIHDAD